MHLIQFMYDSLYSPALLREIVRCHKVYSLSVLPSIFQQCPSPTNFWLYTFTEDHFEKKETCKDWRQRGASPEVSPRPLYWPSSGWPFIPGWPGDKPRCKTEVGPHNTSIYCSVLCSRHLTPPEEGFPSRNSSEQESY